MSNEQRLEELREEASEKGVVTARGVDVAGGPIPRKPGYYGEPVVRPPVWTWEVPVYFFIGGMGGMSAVIAAAAAAFHHVDLARTAILLSLFAAIISPILLILDLGHPRRFLNMLRVFKPQSVMSMGAWILVFFITCALAAFIALEIHARRDFAGPLDSTVRTFAGLLLIGSGLFGVLLATYTGVLIGATAIPAWFSHRVLLPINFGTAGLGSAAALLELLGHRVAPLNAIGFFVAGIETVLALSLVIDRHGAADRALHQAQSGWLIRVAGLLTGPLPLVLRALGLIPPAAISFLLGAFISRFGWLLAGKISGRDPEAVFASQRNLAAASSRFRRSGGPRVRSRRKAATSNG
jgi:formate-dependent nitrite reductase membrane component NrfD